MIRPRALAALRRWQEVAVAGALMALGLWCMALGGLLLFPFGGLLVLLALGWGTIALRRLRFQRGVDAPGVVEIDEGQVGYLGPTFGGFVALQDLAELRLVYLYGAAHWRLKQADGQALLIPLAASGAEKLYDAFAVLPGIDMALLTAALGRGVDTMPLWRRSAAIGKREAINHELS